MEYRIEPHNDPAFAESMERASGWLRGPGEVVRRFHCFPTGHFAAVLPGEDRVGACSVAVYPRDARAWVGGMVVLEKARGHGVARALLQACHDHARSRGVRSIGLDATAMGSRLYESEGYSVVGQCVRWSRPPSSPAPPAPATSAAVYPFSHAELTEVAKYDAVRFGADRSKWLAHILTDNPGPSFVAYDRAKGDLVGFVCSQEAFIGPLVAETKDVADALLHAAEAAGAPPKVQFLRDHPFATSVVVARHYTQEAAATMRMVRGEPWPWKADTLYAQGAWALG